jgi:hypothetical protein
VRRIAIVLVFVLGAPASVQARVHTIAPPGNSGVGQYLETVPTARGAQPTNNVLPVGGGVGGSGGPPGGAAGGTRSTAGPSGGSAIPPSTRRALTAQGSTGAAVAALAQATAPTRADHGASAAASDSGSSPAGSIIKTLTGSNTASGLGPVLPSLLIVSLLGAAVVALVRRRRAS